jgi:Recombinase zinc beta ribbon domain
VYSGPYRNAKAHPALIDPGTWQAAQHPPNMRRHGQLPALLVGGLARCAGCSHALAPLTARKPGQRPYLSYRCRKYHAGGHCPQPAHIAACKLEPYVIEAVYTLLANRRREPVARLAQAEANASAAAAALCRYRDNDRISAAIGQDAFIAGLVTRHRRLADANLEIANARARLGVHALPPAAEVRRTFPTMTLTEQCELVARVIDVAFVAKGHGSAATRVTICPAGTAPRALPRPGDRGRTIRTVTQNAAG